MLLNIYRPTSAPEFDFEANFVNSLGIISWCMPSPVSITLTTTTKKTNFYDSYLSNFELIPYHSEGIPLPSKLSSSQLDYLNIRLKGNLEFIAKFNPRLLLFNGNPWYVLLIKHNLVKEYQKVQISKLLIYTSSKQKASQVCCLTSFSNGIFGE